MDDSEILKAFALKIDDLPAEQKRKAIQQQGETFYYVYDKLFPNALKLFKGNRSDADELAWTAIGEFYLKLQDNPNFKPDKGSSVAYIYRTMRNKWVNYLKLKSKLGDIADETNLDNLPFTPYNPYEERPDLETLAWQELSKMNPTCQEITALRKELDRYDEIAFVLKIDEGTARARFHYCKNILKRRVLEILDNF